MATTRDCHSTLRLVSRVSMSGYVEALSGEVPSRATFGDSSTLVTSHGVVAFNGEPTLTRLHGRVVGGGDSFLAALTAGMPSPVGGGDTMAPSCGDECSGVGSHGDNVE